MSTPSPSDTPAKTGRKARIRSHARALALSGVILTCATTVTVLMNMVATKRAVRLDVTETRSQGLSPRTLQTLAQVQGPHEVVVSVNAATADPITLRDLRDLFGELERGSDGRLKTTLIDTSDPNVEKLVAELVSRVSARGGDRQAELKTAVDAAATKATLAADVLEREIVPALNATRGQIPGTPEVNERNRAFFEQAAATAQTHVSTLRDAAKTAREQLGRSFADLPLPATRDASLTLTKALENARAAMDAFSREIAKFERIPTASTGTPAGAIDAAKAARRGIDGWTLAAATTTDGLRSITLTDAERVAGALQAGPCALVIGPKTGGVSAVDLTALLPEANANVRGAALDTRRRAEDLITSSLASLISGNRPLVVLTHAELEPFLDRLAFFDTLRKRLAIRGVDVIEWAVVTQATPPDLLTVDPDRTRPTVYVTLCPESSAADVAGGVGGQSGAQRAKKLGEVLAKLSDDGAPILLSIAPSVLPTYGEKDPIAAVLDRFGLNAESGRPLLGSTEGPRPVTQTDLLVVGEGEGVAACEIAGAIKGLPTFISWGIPISRKKDATTTITPLLTVGAGVKVWGESQWLTFRQVRRDQRAQGPQPKLDSERDMRSPIDEDGWVVAAAAEVPGKSGPQRLVAVGSNDWFLDSVTTAKSQIDGREVSVYPGNAELFESSVLWLAGQDDFIAQSPTARAVAIVQLLEAEQLRRLRIGLVAGLPAIILLMGAGYGLWRSRR